RVAADALDEHPDVAVVTARILVEPGGSEDPIVAELRHSPVPGRRGLPGPALGSFLAGASVVRRAAFIGAGVSTRGCGTVGRGSCWPRTWRQWAGSCVSYPPRACTITPRWNATRRSGCVPGCATRCGSPGCDGGGRVCCAAPGRC